MVAGHIVSVKKNPERAQGRRKHMALVPVVHSSAPVAPPDLEPEVLARWGRFWDSDFARVVNWERDEMAITRLYQLYSLRVRLERAGAEIFLTGSQGQMILNPALRQLSAVGAEITTLEKLFGMNPQSAVGLGLSLGSLRQSIEDRAKGTDERKTRHQA